MQLKSLNRDSAFIKDEKVKMIYNQFEKLISELRNKDLTVDLVNFVNAKIDEINSHKDLGKELRKKIKKDQAEIIKRLEKDLKIVPINYYRNTWLAIGMAAFGIPLGVAFGASLGNMGYLGIGLPIGMAIGIAVGTAMDKKALEEGRQLDVEIKH
ncbi:MAG TPA: hypothetical protein VJ973_03485 [Christiangramia sp.]|nr:hypothetical protein [Christiangramia sp.]